MIGQVPQQQPGRGRQAGNQPGIDYYETEFTIDELAEMIFADLGLPNLKDKGQQEILSEKIRFTDVRQTGILPNLDKKRSLLQAMKRQAMSSSAAPSGAEKCQRTEDEDAEREQRASAAARCASRRDDLRYRTWNEML